MIRAATHYDIDGIVELFKQCADDPSIDEQHWIDETIHGLTTEGMFTLAAEHEGSLVGFFVGRMAFEPTLHGLVCIEHHWFAKRCGTELRKAAERIAQERGALKMLLHCHDDRVEKLVARAGYRKTYTIYERALTCL